MTAILTPTYKLNDTYSGYTQDVIRLIHEAYERGATRIDIHHEMWNVTVEWPGRTEDQ